MDGRPTPERDLFEAVRNDDPNRVRDLLRGPGDIAAAKNEEGDTILHMAAWEGQQNVVLALIDADKCREIVNIKDAFGGTALHNCAMSGHARIIQLLLNNGADATAMDQEGWTALHHAADEGHLAAVTCLVEHMMEHKMDYNQKTNKTGSTALHIAADRGFARIVDELMSKAASNMTTAWGGETVLHWALEGAIAAGDHLNSVEEAEHEFQDNNLDEEIVTLDDDRNVRFVDWPQEEERAIDIPDQHDAVFERILRDMDGTARWSELLKVACREERIEALQYLMSKMFSPRDAKRLEKPLRRIWLAMSEARTQELMEMLWREAREAMTPALIARLRTEACDNTESMKKWEIKEKWDILSLATSLGKVQTVYWLLRCRRWSKPDLDKAKNLPDHYRINKNDMLLTQGEIWNTPFVRDERSGQESYRWPTSDQDRPNYDIFGSTIMDFYRSDNQIVSIYYNCDPWSLVHLGEDHGPSQTMERSMKSLGNRNITGTVTNEYSDASRCYRWIHLAINSVPWMKDLAMVSYLEKAARRKDWMATWEFLRQSWQELPETRDEESYMRPNCVAGEQSKTPEHDGSMRLALYMPYLTVGPFKHTIPHCENLPIQYRRGIHHRSRTLDQFYHSIPDHTRDRDKDQVFTRYVDWKLKRRIDRKKSDDSEFDILRINQLWLWVIDENTVITSTTQGLDKREDPMFQGFLERLCQSQSVFNREATPSSVDSFVKLITSFYINALDNLKVSLKVPSAPSMRKNPDDPSDEDQAHQPNNTKTYTASLTEVFANSIELNNTKGKGLRQTLRKTMHDNTSRSGDLHHAMIDAMDILDDIQDIREELNIINSVVQEQKTVWSQLFNQSRRSSTRNDAPREGNERYQWSNTDPDYVLKRAKDLLQEAAETEHSITSLLELDLGLEMNQLGLSEAEEARRQGDEARKQGKILMAFTIVTVIFVPLSFLASLFALNISTFPHAGNDVQYHPGWIFGIMFGVTLAFILIILPFTVFQEAFSKTIAEVIPKSQGLLRQTTRFNGLQRDETRRTAGGNGRKSLKERWQQLWGQLRRTNPGGEPAMPAAARHNPGDSGV